MVFMVVSSHQAPVQDLVFPAWLSRILQHEGCLGGGGNLGKPCRIPFGKIGEPWGRLGESPELYKVSIFQLKYHQIYIAHFVGMILQWSVTVGFGLFCLLWNLTSAFLNLTRISLKFLTKPLVIGNIGELIPRKKCRSCLN